MTQRNQDYDDLVERIEKGLFGERGEYQYRGIFTGKRGRTLRASLKRSLRNKHPGFMFAHVTKKLFEPHDAEDEQVNPMDYLAGRGNGKQTAGIALLSEKSHPFLMRPYLDQRGDEVLGNIRNATPLHQELLKLEAAESRVDYAPGSLRWLVANYDTIRRGGDITLTLITHKGRSDDDKAA
jgi:hypothetical protein